MRPANEGSQVVRPCTHGGRSCILCRGLGNAAVFGRREMISRRREWRLWSFSPSRFGAGRPCLLLASQGWKGDVRMRRAETQFAGLICLLVLGAACTKSEGSGGEGGAGGGSTGSGGAASGSAGTTGTGTGVAGSGGKGSGGTGVGAGGTGITGTAGRGAGSTERRGWDHRRRRTGRLDRRWRNRDGDEMQLHPDVVAQQQDPHGWHRRPGRRRWPAPRRRTSTSAPTRITG